MKLYLMFETFSKAKLGNVFHILLHYAVLSQAPRPTAVYIVASLWQAILSLQLLGNHYVKPWNEINDATEGNFFFWQVLSTQDFACPKWARWFYGGLNFHYSHHLFPTLSREYFHLTTPLIRVSSFVSRCLPSFRTLMIISDFSTPSRVFVKNTDFRFKKSLF